MRRLVAALLLVTAACDRPLDHKRLAGRVEDLRAYAAEAHLLATIEHPRHYGVEHREFLVKKIHEARHDLALGVDDVGLEPVRAVAAGLADRLETIVGAGGDPFELEPPLAALDLRMAQ
jgi:hypothetical protein